MDGRTPPRPSSLAEGGGGVRILQVRSQLREAPDGPTGMQGSGGGHGAQSQVQSFPPSL